MSILRAIIFIIFQITLYALVHDGMTMLYKKFFVTGPTDINWGLTEFFAFVIFSVAGVIIAIFYQCFKFRNPSFFLIIMTAFVIFIALDGGNFSYRPYRTSLIIFSSIVGFTVPFLVGQKFLKNKRECE